MDRALDRSVRRSRLIRRAAAGGSVLLLAATVLILLPGWVRPGLRRDRIRIARVERGSLEAAIEASGTVVPAFEKVVSSPLEARVVKIRRKAGETLGPGDEILELDTAATRLEIERLAERLQQKGNEIQQLGLDLEEALAELHGRTESKKLDLEVLDYRVEQHRKLHAEGLIAEEALLATEVEVKKGRIELRRLEESMENARRTSASKADRAGLELRILQKELVEAERQLELATTRADRAGVLTWVVPQEGATVGRGEVIARIADLASYRIEATVSDVHASKLAAGLPVQVVLDERLLPGRLATIHPTIDNGAVRFTVDLADGSDPTLRNNLRVDVLVITETRAGVLKVGKGPFAQGGAVQQVFVVRGDTARRTRATFGLGGRKDYEVLDGLSEGDEVIVSDMQDYLHLDEIQIR